ncbi:MAG: hypothetical protein PUD22_07075 [Erysipelotrichaceae bacterium]|nr:hypothetical protein [Erysipelotrichaceae bacterium]
MPIHFESFGICEDESGDILSSLIDYVEENAKHIFASDDKKIIHLTAELNDSDNKRVLGIVLSMQMHEDFVEILDIDVTSLYASKNHLSFDYRIGDRNITSYYDVMDNSGHHFEIETVNCTVIKGKLVGGSYDVSMTAFPFDIEIHDNIEALNKEKGLDSIKFKDNFTAPSSLFGDHDVYTYVIGKIKSINYHTINLAEKEIPIVIMKTMVGDLELTAVLASSLLPKVPAVGDVIEMYAYINADLSTKEHSYYNK